MKKKNSKNFRKVWVIEPTFWENPDSFLHPVFPHVQWEGYQAPHHCKPDTTQTIRVCDHKRNTTVAENIQTGPFQRRQLEKLGSENPKTILLLHWLSSEGMAPSELHKLPLGVESDMHMRMHKLMRLLCSTLNFFDVVTWLSTVWKSGEQKLGKDGRLQMGNFWSSWPRNKNVKMGMLGQLTSVGYAFPGSWSVGGSCLSQHPFAKCGSSQLQKPGPPPRSQSMHQFQLHNILGKLHIQN